MRKRIEGILVMGILISGTLMMHAGTPAEAILGLDRPMVIGHRGYPTIAPENTLPGFELAKLAGADLVELDYHFSRDGQAIVIHDATLDRTTDSARAWGEEEVSVSEKTVDEMKELDAGSWYSDRYAGTRLPTLLEALEVIQADDGMTLIERKGGPAGQIVDLLKHHKLLNQVVVQSFDWDYLREVHALEASQVLWALGPQKKWDGEKVSKKDRNLSPDWIDRAMKTGARAIAWNNSVDREAVAYAHDRGLKVIVYTINDIEQAQELLNIGVDGIITNNVSLIWRAIALMDEEG